MRQCRNRFLLERRP